MQLRWRLVSLKKKKANNTVTREKEFTSCDLCVATFRLLNHFSLSLGNLVASAEYWTSKQGSRNILINTMWRCLGELVFFSASLISSSMLMLSELVLKKVLLTAAQHRRGEERRGDKGQTEIEKRRRGWIQNKGKSKKSTEQRRKEKVELCLRV